jgi:hypothetical protein
MRYLIQRCKKRSGQNYGPLHISVDDMVTTLCGQEVRYDGSWRIVDNSGTGKATCACCKKREEEDE